MEIGPPADTSGCSSMTECRDNLNVVIVQITHQCALTRSSRKIVLRGRGKSIIRYQRKKSESQQNRHKALSLRRGEGEWKIRKAPRGHKILLLNIRANFWDIRKFLAAALKGATRWRSSRVDVLVEKGVPTRDVRSYCRDYLLNIRYRRWGGKSQSDEDAEGTAVGEAGSEGSPTTHQTSFGEKTWNVQHRFLYLHARNQKLDEIPAERVECF